MKYNKNSFRTVVGIILIFFLSSELALLILAIWALLDSKHSIQALSLLSIGLFLNPGLMSSTTYFSIARWIVIFACVVRILYESVSVQISLPIGVKSLLLFSLIVLLEAILVSKNLFFSTSKLLIFSLVSVSILLGYELQKGDKKFWENWFFNIYLAIIILSFPTLFVPFIGWRDTSFLFQGILNHPQALGVFLSVFNAWVSGNVLFDDTKTTNLQIITLCLGFLYLFASGSRTSFFSILIGLISMIFIVLLLGRDKWKFKIHSLLYSPVTIVITSLFFSTLLLSPYFQNETMAFFLKSDKTQKSILKDLPTSQVPSKIVESRSALIERSFNNFLKYPLMGIGYGMPSSNQKTWWSLQYDPIFNVFPISGSTEKGFLPSLILEELGMIGAFMFIFLLVMLFRPIVLKGSISKGCLFITCIATNLGEATLFSVGGFGLLLWLLIGYSSTIQST